MTVKRYELRVTDRAGASFYETCVGWVDVVRRSYKHAGKRLDLFGRSGGVDGLTDDERADFEWFR